MPVLQEAAHTHIAGGEAMESKTLKIGNSTVIIHSSLLSMTADEQQNWFEEEWQKKNPIVRGIVDAVLACEPVMKGAKK